MPADRRILDLLGAWQKSEGHLSPEEICATDPELVEELLACIDRLRALAIPSAGVDQGAGSLLENRYLLLRRLGGGGMGEVYEAQDLRVADRRVAVKLLSPRLREEAPAAAACLEVEVGMLAGLRHPGIVQVLDAAPLGSSPPYFVMEYVDGPHLEQYVQRSMPPLEERLRLLVEACRAMHRAHEAGILHRDLKPENILVRQPDDPARRQPVVIDFGVALSLDARAGAFAGEHFSGTLGWLSPEQFSLPPGELDRRADVYALGLIGFLLATENLPYPVTADIELMRQRICDLPAAPPRQFRPGLPADLEAILLHALACDRARRYPTAAELADDVERFLAGRPVCAHLAGLGLAARAAYVLGKLFHRRTRLCVAACAAGVLVAALAIAALLAQRAGQRVQDERRDFQIQLQEVVHCMNAGEYDRAGQVIDRAIARWPQSSEERVLLESHRNIVRLLQLAQAYPASGAAASRSLPDTAAPPARQRSLGIAWRGADERKTVAAALDELLATGHAGLTGADSHAMVHIAGLLADLDQYARAEEALGRLPPAARESWECRLVQCVLEARRAVSVGEGDARLADIAGRLQTLLAEAEADGRLRPEAPRVLYNLAMVAAARGNDIDAQRWLRAAAGHPAASQRLRDWLAKGDLF